MKTVWLSSIAAAALLAGGGLASAQMEPSQGHMTGAPQGGMQRQPGAMMQHQPGAMQNPAQRSAQPMQGMTQGRSNATDMQDRSNARGNMRGRQPREGMDQGRSGEMDSGAVGERGQHGSSQMNENKNSRPGQSMSQRNNGAIEQRSVAKGNITSDQRTKIHDIVSTGNLRRAENVNFAVRVGTRIPRSVQIYGVPETIVEIVPQYRGFDYIIVGNDLLIIDPRTLQIVYVLPV
ncbi:MAG TPA: DUF1236 domain-containing protein [Methylocella sp.]|jgi:hypothetical protein